MTTAPLTHTDTLVLDYLAALWAAGDDLPPEARDELMSTVAGYVALRRDLAEDPAGVLARLGPPEQLVAAVRRSGTPAHLRLPPSSAPVPPVPSSSPPSSSLPPARSGTEHAAVALLIGGTFVLPLLSPVAGMLLAAGSPRWAPEQKGAAWLLTGGSMCGGLLFALLVAGAPLFSGVAALLLYLASGAGSVAAGLTLLAGMRRG